MSFLIQRTAGRGLSLTQISSAILRIGRGTNQELRSENPAVALEHAIIEGDAAGYLITDKGSITGTYVNRKPVESSRLAKGDVIEIGDLRIEVQLADPSKPLFLRVVTSRVAPAAVFDDEDEDEVAAPTATPGARIVKPKKIDYVGAYRLNRPYLTKVGLTALLVIIALAVVGEIIRPERQTTFMPGSISSTHSRKRDPEGAPIADRCDACHLPFNSVSNQKCMKCHPHEAHARFETKPPDCFTCHAEHRGQTKLAEMGDERCIGCHADLGAHVRVPRAQLASVRFGGGRYSFDNIARIPVFGDKHPQLVYAQDSNTLGFNHKLHLAPRGVFNETGRREVLECKSCHELVTVKEKIDPAAVDYEAHCQRCHRLTFDARFPKDEVPHGGDPGNVYGFIGIMYSGSRDLVGKLPAEVRRILTARKGIDVGLGAQVSIEHVIKTKCKKCHDIVPRGDKLAAVPPVIPAEWLATAHFTHTSHVSIDCEKCHTGVRQSVRTSDVLLPGIQKCANCHEPNAKEGQAEGACLTCHRYHLRPVKHGVVSLGAAGMSIAGSGGRMLQEILLVVIVVLLLVVLVPVGIALFQRLRPERSAPPREPAAPPRPIPPTTSKIPAIQADIPTDKAVRREDIPVPPPPPAPSPPPPVPAIDRTRIPDEPMGAGTEMVQWYGLLNCTGGPLEGQRFIIEEDGFYIGRDPSLAKVVVPDTKVSKRHVRIITRDGKVWAVDQGSTNGTFLAGTAGRITEVQLKRGDTLIIGDAVATFVYQI